MNQFKFTGLIDALRIRIANLVDVGGHAEADALAAVLAALTAAADLAEERGL